MLPGFEILFGSFRKDHLGVIHAHNLRSRVTRCVMLAHSYYWYITKAFRDILSISYHRKMSWEDAPSISMIFERLFRDDYLIIIFDISRPAEFEIRQQYGDSEPL